MAQGKLNRRVGKSGQKTRLVPSIGIPRLESPVEEIFRRAHPLRDGHSWSFLCIYSRDKIHATASLASFGFLFFSFLSLPSVCLFSPFFSTAILDI